MQIRKSKKHLWKTSKKTLELPGNHSIVYFDEFSVAERPSTSYAWAEVNTRPKVKSNERNRKRVNGLLAVDMETAQPFFQARARVRSTEVAEYFADLATELAGQGRTGALVVLDNYSTHKSKMRKELSEMILERNLNFSIEFLDLPAYSPMLNVAEYVIRMVRQLCLHHSPHQRSMEEVENRLIAQMTDCQFITKDKLINILDHACNLPFL